MVYEEGENTVSVEFWLLHDSLGGMGLLSLIVNYSHTYVEYQIMEYIKFT